MTAVAFFGSCAVFGAAMALMLTAATGHHQRQLARLRPSSAPREQHSAASSELQLRVLPLVRSFFFAWTGLALLATLIGAIVALA